MAKKIEKALVFKLPKIIKPCVLLHLAPKLTSSLTRCGHLFPNLASESLNLSGISC